MSPEVVRRHFKSRGGNVPHQSIDFLEFLKTEEDSADSLNDSATQSIRIKKKNAAFLLSYCLGDLQVALCSSAAGDNDSDSHAALLYRLPLLPTEVCSEICALDLDMHLLVVVYFPRVEASTQFFYLLQTLRCTWRRN